MRLVVKIGSGISRMQNLMQKEGLTLPEFNTDGMFTIIFRRPIEFER